MEEEGMKILRIVRLMLANPPLFAKKSLNQMIKFKEELTVQARIHRLQNLKEKPSKGSADWLALCELKMGGLQRHVKRTKVSDYDPRTQEKILEGGMTGGDRMIHHNYSKVYERYLRSFINKTDSLNILECGILKGTGLAVWSELFPTAHLIGLDIDLDHTKSNLDFLRGIGAFEHNKLSLLNFDQFAPDTTELGELLGPQNLDIIIDDGFHSDETILNTLRALKPFFADTFVYFAEDNVTVSQKLKNQFPEYTVESYGQMTVITPKL